MIALDTNVIVRYLVDDDAEQAEAARVLVEGLTPDSQGFICREVCYRGRLGIGTISTGSRAPRLQMSWSS